MSVTLMKNFVFSEVPENIIDPKPSSPVAI